MAFRQYGIAATPVRNKSIQIQFRYFSKFDMYGNSPTPANKQRFVPTSGTYPKGFLAGGTSIRIKPARDSRPDLVLVASERPCCGAAVFTRNEFPAASITVTKDLMRKSQGRGLRGFIVNAGCANTLTGKAGLEDATAMSKEADKHVSGEIGAERESSVMVMHTGVGQRRRTTDTFPKLASRTFGLPSLPNTTFSLAGITKGAGMIHPNMATTLGIICTDAPITPPALQHLLSTAASTSYNSISIDGDTSTNDMVVMLANGAAAPNETRDIDYCPSSPHQSPDFLALQHTLDDFMATMAKLVVRDGEGASKFITIRVRNSPTSAIGAAKHIASVIARSVLVKTAIYGKEANWGGVLAALGYSLIDTEYEGKGFIDPALTSVSFLAGEEREEVKFLERGVPVRVEEERVRGVMEREDVEVVVDLRDEGNGREAEGEEAVYWTSDLTHEFVTMNGDFSVESSTGVSVECIIMFAKNGTMWISTKHEHLHSKRYLETKAIRWFQGKSPLTIMLKREYTAN